MKSWSRREATYLLYGSYKSRKASAIVSGRRTVNEWVVAICSDCFALRGGNKHSVRIGRHDRR